MQRENYLEPILLDGRPLTLSEIESVAARLCPVTLAPEAHARVVQSRRVIEQILATGQTVYGVNTGFLGKDWRT